MTDHSTGANRRASNWLDVVLFGLAFLVGLAVYLLVRAFFGRAGQLVITLTLMGVMLAYAVLVVFVPRLRVRMDQAGDNSYYLGLLFTLMSMAFALYDFRAEVQIRVSAASNTTGVQQIISNFGTALGTTIVGIFLRVTLHQMRVDPADLESTTRIELTEAAERLRATLDSITTGLGRFHQELQQRSHDVTGELLDEVRRTATSMNSDTIEATRRVTLAAEQSYQDIASKTREVAKDLAGVAGEAASAAQRLKGVEAPPLTLSRRLEKVASVLEQVALQGERTTAALRDSSDASTRGSEGIVRTSELLEQMASRLKDEHSSTTQYVKATARELAESLDPFTSRLQSTLHQLAELEIRVTQSADESVKAQRAAGAVLAHLSELTRGLTEALKKANSDAHARD